MPYRPGADRTGLESHRGIARVWNRITGLESHRTRGKLDSCQWCASRKPSCSQYQRSGEQIQYFNLCEDSHSLFTQEPPEADAAEDTPRTDLQVKRCSTTSVYMCAQLTDVACLHMHLFLRNGVQRSESDITPPAPLKAPRPSLHRNGARVSLMIIQKAVRSRTYAHQVKSQILRGMLRAK